VHRTLITPDELAEAMGGPRPPVLLDARYNLTGPSAREEYARGHLPGAVFVDVDTELSGPRDPRGVGGRHPLPDPRHLQEVLRRAGVRAGHPVVAYDGGSGGMAAARVWWLLRWAGHEAVAVLDGGYAAWVAAGYPVTREVPEPEPGDVVVRPGGMPVVDAEGAAALADTGVLLDARAAERYRGEVEPVDPRAGHIPGARNAPFVEHVGPDGRWRTAEQLRERFTALGVEPDGPVGAYCGSGVSACAVVLALEVAGLTTADRPAALYPGSWSEWSSDPARPVATGDDPH